MGLSSLHVKYRPKTLDDVIGQDDTVKSLKRVIKDNRAHVFLFTSLLPGVGKTTLARILASIYAGGEITAANIEEIAAADSTGVDAMREIIRHTLYRAIGASPIKAVILDEVHRLSGAAFDVLLKPIEEPPAHVYWFFCSTNPGRIPKTIISRCLRYDLKPVSEDDLLELLVRVIDAEKLEINDDVVEAVVEEAQGSPRQALVFLEAVAYCETASEARVAMRSAGQSREAIDLCRFLLSGQGRSWAEAMRLVKAMGDVEAESVRIVVTQYLASVAMSAKKNDRAADALAMLASFSGKTYNPSDKAAPLLLSIGMALELDR
jgi:DNA polymerase III gamma/tau subunit